MIVSGLRRVGSTRRSLSWPADQREPAPDKSGASVPWNLSSGNGPVWHRRQAPRRRSNTIARPRAGSPPVPVSDAGIASPATAKGRNGRSSAIAATPAPARNTAASAASGEGFGRDRAEPGFRIAGFEGAKIGGRIDPAHTAGAPSIGARGLDRGHLPTIRQRYPFDQLGVELLPGSLEQALLRKAVLCIEHDQLRTRFRFFEVIGDQARSLVGAGRAAERIGGGRDHDYSAIGHRFLPTPPPQRLIARPAAMPTHRGPRRVVTRGGGPTTAATRRH